MSNFDSGPLTCDAVLFPAKNNPNSAKSNRISPGKGRGNGALILTYLDSPIAEDFYYSCLFFSICAIVREKRGMQTFGLPFFNKILNPPKNIFVF